MMVGWRCLEAIDNELIELRSKHSVDAVHLSLQEGLLE